MAELSVQQGTEGGPSTSLPQGAASEVNANLTETTAPTGESIDVPVPSAAPESGGAEAPAAAEDTSEPELAADTDYEPIYTPEGEDDVFITGPTTRPDENVTTGAFAGGVRPLSPELAAALPTFVEAASMPDAPEQLRALVALLSQASGS